MRTYVRATSFGVAANGGKIRPGDKFWHDGPLGKWMEPVEGANEALAPAPSEPAADEQPKSEAAGEEPAENKRKLRNRKPAEGAE